MHDFRKEEPYLNLQNRYIHWFEGMENKEEIKQFILSKISSYEKAVKHMQSLDEEVIVSLDPGTVNNFYSSLDAWIAIKRIFIEGKASRSIYPMCQISWSVLMQKFFNGGY